MNRRFRSPTVMILATLFGAAGCGGEKEGIDAGRDAAALDAPAAGEAADRPAVADADDAPAAGSDATDLPPQTDGPGEESAPVPQSIVVQAAQNFLALDACGVTAAVFPDVPAGSYRILLATSTLSKGGVSGTDPPLPAVDNYVIVSPPVAPGDAQEDRRFFMLNGIGAGADLTLTAAGTIRVMFVDSDGGSNAGEATVTLEPGGYSVTVSAATNVLRWQEGCASTPAMVTVETRPHRVALVESTLSAGAGSRDNFVLVRLPSERPMDDRRFVILNGVGASHDFTPFNSSTIRAWFIGATGGGSGQALLSVSPL
jgi:hypothetical protein